MKSPLRTVRALTAFIIFGLVVSGLTAFPLLHELNLLAGLLTGPGGDLDPANHTGLAHWILLVRQGLEETYGAYPFMAYGTDWLAFGHLVIALFFIPAYKNPVRYQDVYRAGIWASCLVIPLAFICGHIREIPIYWRLIDCSFGIIAVVPLLYILALTRTMEHKDRPAY